MNKNSYILNGWASTHVGKVRTNNEDNFLFNHKIVDDTQNELAYQNKFNTENVQLFGVFDGMGGHAAGEKASLITASYANEFTFDNEMIEAGLEHICLQANQLVCDEMRELKLRIGTTASMIAFYNKAACICNVGDTPIYLCRNHQLYQLHEEHTERKMYERIYGKEIPNKKYRLTQNIGIFEEEMLIKPYLNVIDIQPDDQLLICSDGLSDMVCDDEILEILDNKKHDEKLSILQQKALDAGGRDNITMILIHVSKHKMFSFL